MSQNFSAEIFSRFLNFQDLKQDLKFWRFSAGYRYFQNFKQVADILQMFPLLYTPGLAGPGDTYLQVTCTISDTVLKVCSVNVQFSILTFLWYFQRRIEGPSGHSRPDVYNSIWDPGTQYMSSLFLLFHCSCHLGCKIDDLHNHPVGQLISLNLINIKHIKGCWNLCVS